MTWIDKVLRLLARSALRTFYRQIDILGRERIPTSGSCIFVGNHGNGLIDPALGMGFLPPIPRFLGKATLWSHPVVGPFLRLARAIPIHRRQDPNADMGKNESAFEAAAAHLANGGSLCIFPEGMSHDAPSLQRMKTGTARIALQTVISHPDVDLKVVPFGLAFSARDRFRSRVGIVIGDSIDVRVGSDVDQWSQVESLTGKIEEGLESVTLNYRSWDEQRLVRRAVDLFYREPGRSERRATGDRFDTHQRFSAAYQELLRKHPERTHGAAESVLAYDDLLKLIGVTDRQVLESLPLRRLSGLILRSLLFVLIALPIAAFGFALHAVPWLLARGLPRWTRQPLHQRATYAVMSGILLVPAAWIIACVWAVRTWGWKGAWMLVLAPVSGWITLRVAETLHGLWHTGRGLIALRLGRRTRDLLRRRRAEAQAAVADLADIYTRPLPGAEKFQ